jgi:hypothetical protein
LKALTSGSSDFSKQGLVADSANPSTYFFNEICQDQTFAIIGFWAENKAPDSDFLYTLDESDGNSVQLI